MTTFQGRYRIASVRLAGYDYVTPGLYFVTCCTHQRAELFGERWGDAGVVLSRLGHLVSAIWHSIPLVHATVTLSAFVAMPDHVHALIGLPGDVALAHVVNQAKGRVTREAHALGLHEGTVWQPRFHDRIVRSDREANAVRQYIAQNPFKQGPP